MERNAAKKNIETISRKDKLSPEMAFVAIINTDTPVRADELDWRKEGACNMTNAEAFYPSIGESVKEAKAICDRCDIKVKAACLEDALAHKEPYGVRGGLTVRERDRLLRKRQQTDAAA